MLNHRDLGYRMHVSVRMRTNGFGIAPCVAHADVLTVRQLMALQTRLERTETMKIADLYFVTRLPPLSAGIAAVAFHRHP